LAATSSSRFVIPNYWADSKSGLAYQVQVQVPQSQMTSVQDVKHIPVTPGTVSHPLWGDVAQVNYGNVVGEYHRLNGRHQQLRALSLEMICMGKCHRKKERISKGELSCVLFETY
jgi:hypothetical protein